MKTMSAPMSCGCSMRAKVSGVSGIGRLSRIGVATSPGQSTDERMPFWHSSRLMVWLMATMPCLAAT